MTTTKNLSSENLDGICVCNISEAGCEACFLEHDGRCAELPDSREKCCYCGEPAEGAGYLGESICHECFMKQQDKPKTEGNYPDGCSDEDIDADYLSKAGLSLTEWDYRETLKRANHGQSDFTREKNAGNCCVEGSKLCAFGGFKSEDACKSCINKYTGDKFKVAELIKLDDFLEEMAAESEELEQERRELEEDVIARNASDVAIMQKIEYDLYRMVEAADEKACKKVCEQVSDYGNSKNAPAISAGANGAKGNYVIDKITDKVIQLLEAGQIPWRKPWTINGATPMNLITQKPYRGANCFFLSLYSMNFTSPYFLSFKQAKDLGGSVIAGSKSIPVVFWKWFKNDIDDEDEEARPIVRFYSVFNAEQCAGINDKIPELDVKTFDNTPIERAEKVIESWKDKPEIKFGNLACYNQTNDVITIPEIKYFENVSEYYSTEFHESIHATGHKNRLHRLNEHSIFGSNVYSKEELIAEFGAAYLCGECGIDNDKTLFNSAAYIQGWLNKLKGDRRSIIYAAASAQKAVDYVLNRKEVTQEN